MTGFGAADGEVGGGRVSVEVRSVNHRFFSPSIKLPGALARLEGDVRDALRRGVTRGHVTVSARFERDNDGDVELTPIDEARFAAYVERLRGLQQQHGLTDTLDVATILRMPDVFSGATREELPAEAGAQLVAIVDRAVLALLEMRAAQPDGVGKRLGFLLQEMLREANTTGSKGNDAAIVADVLLVKEELERIRVQVENLE